MIIKGKSVGGADRLAKHLTRADTNERVEVKELRGVVAEDLRGALLEIEAVSAGTRTTKPFYHASISSRAEERLTDEQRAHAIDRLESELGLTGQPRVVVVHEKEGREHCHIVWSRIDLENMRAISDSHNYRKHELVARELEREFGHERVQGAHIERDGKERPKRTPSHAEMLQAERTGMSPQEAKAKITELWRSTDTGQAFAAALENNGWILARGDRRDFVVIDPMGGTHSLSRRIEGANARDVRARLADIDPARLPTVAEAKQIQRARQERDAERVHEIAHQPERDAPKAHGFDRSTAEAARATHAVASGIGAVIDGVANAFESLLGGGDQTPQTPEERAEAARAQQEAAAVRADAAAAAEQDRKLGESGPKKHRQQLLRDFGRERDEDLRHDFDRARERTRRGD